MNRKPIFDAVRAMLGRGFTSDEVKALDLACNLAEAAVERPEAKPASVVAAPAAATSVAGAVAGAVVEIATSDVEAVEVLLGKLSEKFESGGRGPGTVSSGAGDPGGVSYGTYQLSSTAGTLTAFLKKEGKPWIDQFGTAKPGTASFTTVWKKIAAEDKTFGAAQHAFIHRTHYQPAVSTVRDAKGLDFDRRHRAVREVVWSVSVQHARASRILIESINICDRDHDRNSDDYDRLLIEAMYDARTAYVLEVAANPKLSKAEREQLVSITKKRYPTERADALALFAAGASAAEPVAKPVPAAPPAPTNGAGEETIDGNAVAAKNGVLVKSSAVKISRLHRKMEPVIVAVAAAAKKLGLPQPVITSGNDSNHMKGSRHFTGCALDFRGNNIQPNVGDKLAAEVSKILGNEYDAIFERFMNTSNNHLHVEYDPS
ncbi:chitosanase [Sphingomonas radiodurans]|uniref:chitosanase n=1 Tax=Sphingomonas radiodurans TaxID=2890321 RepID=UPI001E378727|nr:chitosanase [Sphingomonas radiodurans]WBH16809.1 chitosanase [Sphingomonas radiodurans]